ncbi:hypothetical protein OE810_13125, partial [Rhodobacteraceae bacterium XHP0102]|nr:hypothetical protein [Rhodobacteraceae bacterium XHP0102]
MAKDLEITSKVATGLSNSARKDEALKKLIGAWNSKSVQAGKRVGTFGLMAAALAACGGGGSGGSGTDGGGNTISFGVTPVVAGATTVSGTFAFFDSADAEITSITADTQDIADKLLEYAVEGTPEDVTGVTTINLAGGVTLVATVEDLAQVQVTGSGNVWALVGTAVPAVADHGTFALDIDITGDLIFDMDGDTRGGLDQEVAITGTIDLNFGDIIVSDGVVDLTGAALARIGQTVEINSTLIMTYDQFVAALEAETSFSGAGNLVVKMGPTDGDLLEGYLAVSHLLGQVQLQDPIAGPKTFILEGSGGAQSLEVSPQDIELTVSRFVDQALTLLEQRIQGFADSEDFTTLASIAGDFSALSAAITTLQGSVGTDDGEGDLFTRLDALETAVNTELENRVADLEL